MEPGPMEWVQPPGDGARTPYKDPSQPWAGLPHAGRGVLTPPLPHAGPELVSGHLNECTGLVRVSEEEAVPDPAPPPRSPAPSTHCPDAEAAVAFATPCGDSGTGRRGDGPTPSERGTWCWPHHRDLGAGLCLGGSFWKTGMGRGWMEGERGHSTPKPRARGEQEGLMLFPYENPKGLSRPWGQPPRLLSPCNAPPAWCCHREGP